MREVYIQNFTLVQDENGKYHPVMKLEAVTDEMLKQQTMTPFVPYFSIKQISEKKIVDIQYKII